ncbi:ABC transporter permease [Devosia sp. 1566]|uniref:ABC transporter permease n=1 Tax=Devosia sp. 1566 TaxID=2499144 RepID=UPI0013E33F07|nr:ABC transporter permease [Devosia sp. 1566]
MQLSSKAQRPFMAALLTPVTLLYVVFLIAPIGFFLALSFMTYSPMQMFAMPLTLDNYGRLLLDDHYRSIIYSTLRVSLTVTALAALGGYTLAYFLSRLNSVWRGVLLFLVIAPLMTGVIVRTYGWIVLLGSDGLINTILIGLGIIDRPLSMLNSEGTVVVALVHIMLPYMVFPIFSSLVSQDSNLVPAATTLGAGKPRAFFEVTLPLSRSGIIMGSALVFTMTSGSIVTADLLGGRDLSMMGPLIYDLILSTFNWPLGAAVGALLVMTQFVILSLIFRRNGRA